VPPVCILDPDGDLVRRLVADGAARRDVAWACYHTELYRSVQDDIELGLVGCAVGAPFAVLVAEQLFASGCRFLVSMTSAGQLVPLRPPPYFVLIERALRDEGTSYHYMAPSAFSAIDDGVLAMMRGAFDHLRIPVLQGATWTTDAPFRETAEAIAAMKTKGLLAVEMEAAALYAFATAREKPVLCFSARHQPDGPDPWRLREGRSRRHRRCPRRNPRGSKVVRCTGPRNEPWLRPSLPIRWDCLDGAVSSRRRQLSPADVIGHSPGSKEMLAGLPARTTRSC